MIRAACRPGRQVMARLDELARFTDEPGQLTRLYLTPAAQGARRSRCGLDGGGRDGGASRRRRQRRRPLRGGEPGPPGAAARARTSTRCAMPASYDGNFGVLAAIEAVAELHEQGERLPFAIEVLAFGDEEGVRFPVTLTGSRAVAGTLDPAALDARDADGISSARRCSSFGCDPAAHPVAPPRRGCRSPMSSCTSSRARCWRPRTCRSASSPRSTAPAASRSRSRAWPAMPAPCRWTCARTRCAAAAEMVLAVERAPWRRDATSSPPSGRIEALPGAVNVIPAGVTLHASTSAARATPHGSDVVARLRDELAAIAALRGVERPHRRAPTRSRQPPAPPR